MVVLPVAGYLLFTRPAKEADVTEARFAPVSQWTTDPGLSVAPAFSHNLLDRHGAAGPVASSRAGAAVAHSRAGYLAGGFRDGYHRRHKNAPCGFWMLDFGCLRIRYRVPDFTI
jgi:hypothetical protein